MEIMQFFLSSGYNTFIFLLVFSMLIAFIIGALGSILSTIKYRIKHETIRQNGYPPNTDAEGDFLESYENE